VRPAAQLLFTASRPGRPKTESAQDVRRDGKKKRPSNFLGPAHFALEQSMSSHLKWFVLGIVIALVVVAGGVYLFVNTGGMRKVAAC
jgi:hypothetical protein